MKEQSENFEMVAKTLAGLEQILAAELLKLGAQKIEPLVRGVRFYGDEGFMYKANLCLRTALSILKPIAYFRVRNEKELYKHSFNLDWPSIFTSKQTFAIQAIVNSTQFNHSQYAALKVKDAIVDKFREVGLPRPDISKTDPDIKINVHINREKVTISLDSSGEPLFKRGYKTEVGQAPINEVLAAGLIHLSDWNGLGCFVDPMCGSGTILIEAVMMAMNIPAQFKREHFGFMNWQSFDAELFELINSSMMNRIKDTHAQFIGYDNHPAMTRIAKDNIANAGLEEFISIQRKDFFSSSKPEKQTFLLFNPPYGERLSISKEGFYKKIGDTLKQNYVPSTAWLITSDFDGVKRLGLRASKKIALKNGALDCKLMRFDVYEGSKKAAKQ